MQRQAQNHIAFIFTSRTTWEMTRSVLKERGEQFPVFFTELDRSLELAEELISQGARIIVSRGGVCSWLQQNLWHTPVIPIQYSYSDFAASIEEASKYSRKIAIVSFNQAITAAHRLEKYFNVQTALVKVDDAASIDRMLQELKESGIEVLIGGYSLQAAAQRYNIRCVPLATNRYSIIAAIEEALNTSAVIYDQETRIQTITSILNCTTSGIIALDRDGIITSANALAKQFLGASAGCLEGRSHTEFLPVTAAFGRALQGESIFREIIELEAGYLAANYVPIQVDGEIVGVVISIQESREIMALEGKIRKQILTRGHVARSTFEDIVGSSDAMREAKHKAVTYAQVDSTVLLYGETGTGKELFAQSIHNASPRRNAPFVAVNCAALPQSILESELFGYVKGAFTGARTEGKAGIFELAHTGTIFLDEISEMPLELQSRLLRVLQEKEITRLGSEKVIPVDVRILTATNRNLMQEVEQGHFRRDLYYRLCVLVLRLPPLRERPGDLPQLCEYFLRVFTRKYNRVIHCFQPEALKILEDQPFLGNIRELSNLIERCVILCKRDHVDSSTLLETIAEDFPQTDVPKSIASSVALVPSQDERDPIVQALERTGWSRQRAAELLGISRTSLWRRMKELNINKPGRS